MHLRYAVAVAATICVAIAAPVRTAAQNPGRSNGESGRYELPTSRGVLADSGAIGSYRRSDLMGKHVLGIRRPGKRAFHSKRSLVAADVGDTLTFQTPLVLAGAWAPLHFTLVAETDTVRLWVATDELTAGDVDQADVDSLMASLLTKTPPGSYDPSSGIAEISGAVFGEVSKIDGDSVVDVLWFDIADDYSGPGTGFTPVVVAQDDIDPAAPDGAGNRADVIYLDSFPTLTGPDQGIEVARASIAGGYQALIHLNYDPGEGTFVRTGLFEWAKILNGFEGPLTEYLSQTGEHNVGLLSFEGFIGDRERSALFVRYIADQLGVGAVGDLTRDSTSDAAGLANMLAASSDTRSLSTFIADFHTANLVADTSINPAYGYGDPALSSPLAAPTLSVDGSLNMGFPPGGIVMQPGGVLYLRWENVDDLEVRLDTVEPADRARFIARAVARSVSGSLSVRDLDLSTTSQLIEGANDDVTVVLVHAALNEAAASAVVASEWAGTAYPTTNFVRDNGEYNDVPAVNFISLGDAWTQAVRFERPNGTVLHKVFAAPIYKNQFIDPSTGLLFGSPRDPRDFTLLVFADDGFGVPGDTLLRRLYTDRRPYALQTSRTIAFLEINLSDIPDLGVGESILFVGIEEAGSDANNLMLGLSSYQAEDVSYLYGPIGPPPSSWHTIWGLNADGQSLEGSSIPIRGQFRSTQPVAVEDVGGLSFELEIVGTYPNPTSGWTNLVFSMDRAGECSADVFDVLGRRVLTKRLSILAPGTHVRAIDTAALASGTYFVRIRGAAAKASTASKFVVVR